VPHRRSNTTAHPRLKDIRRSRTTALREFSGQSEVTAVLTRLIRQQGYGYQPPPSPQPQYNNYGGQYGQPTPPPQQYGYNQVSSEFCRLGYNADADRDHPLPNSTVLPNMEPLHRDRQDLVRGSV
jgi:hypothetical protein